MIDDLETPMAIGKVVWLSVEEGGRRSGPPTAPVYAATCVVELGGEAETIPGWPAAADALSIWLQAVEGYGSRGGRYKVDFPVRELARPLVSVGAQFLVMEGPRLVAHLTLTEVMPDISSDP